MLHPHGPHAGLVRAVDIDARVVANKQDLLGWYLELLSRCQEQGRVWFCCAEAL
jgi:hypothetical protein